MKEHISHPAQMVLTGIGVLILAGLAILYAVMGNGWACLIFLALTCLYFCFCRDAFYLVTIDTSGVTQRFFWRKKSIDWESIREAGVLAANVMKRRQHGKRPSRCHIYYSEKVLTNEERLLAGLKPQKYLITVTYTPERLRKTTACWPQQMILFNVTAKELFGAEIALPDLNMREIHY